MRHEGQRCSLGHGCVRRVYARVRVSSPRHARELLVVASVVGSQVADDILDIEASSEDLGKTAGKDEAVDKTTYPKLLGLERSKEVAQELVDEAKAALAEFGDAAAPLNG